MTPEGRSFVYLAYMDDSGTRDKKEAYQVVAAVLVDDSHFFAIENLTAAFAEAVIPAGKLESFEEFKGSELYGGYGIFDGVDQKIRFELITRLLSIIKNLKIPVVYGAVHKNRLATNLYGSAEPVDICFRICMNGVNDAMRERLRKDMALIIVDDSDRDVKKKFKQSFRAMRGRTVGSEAIIQFRRLHDDMYFGSSRDSVGIQLADLCAFFVNQHLKGDDPVAESFYTVFGDSIIYSKVEPENDATKKGQAAQ